MCIQCLSRAIGEMRQIEDAVVASGGSRVAGLQVVEHKHCGDLNCQHESHCHVRTRRHDASRGEWFRTNGCAAQVATVRDAEFGASVPLERFEEQYEADEQGISAATLEAVEAFSRLASSRARCADAECAICMDTLDATDLVGGFKRMTGGSHALVLPCGHPFHPACYKAWAAKHRTCPCCRREVTEASVADARASKRPDSERADSERADSERAVAPQSTPTTPQSPLTQLLRGLPPSAPRDGGGGGGGGGGAEDSSPSPQRSVLASPSRSPFSRAMRTATTLLSRRR